ncbi:hypothetical protein LCGC14_3035250 [marine sediment metagenome]|uniref:Uncharacterized protein n=1 Tax=marine sediment metagenome TaxID=412755 RepID=A0A0F8XEJ5_9ZZZZ
MLKLLKIIPNLDKQEYLNCKIKSNIQTIEYYNLTEKSNKNIVVNKLKLENGKLELKMIKLKEGN